MRLSSARKVNYGLSQTLSEAPIIKSPETQLIAAIIHRAVMDFLYYEDHKKFGFAFLTAKSWLFADSKKVTPFNFEWCCEHLQPDNYDLSKNIRRLVLNAKDAERLAYRKCNTVWKKKRYSKGLYENIY